MIMRGRPLGFIGLVLAGWTTARALMLWPGAAEVRQVVAALRVPLIAKAAAATVPPSFIATVVPASLVAVPARRRGPGLMSDAQIVALYGLRYYYEDRPSVTDGAAALLPPPTSAPPPPSDATGAAVASVVASASRWSLSAWLVAREGRSDPRLGPLLGASQAGARLSYAFDDARRTAAFVRVAAPLAHGGAEAGAGLQWRPTRAPVTAFVEARARSGGIAPAVGAFGGGSANLPAGFRLDGYAQAGWVGGRDASGFADGQARAGRMIAAAGSARFDAGVGLWGAAQRGAHRLDIGPGIGVDLPVGKTAFRLAVDWRQRVAGNAAPNSGLALTLGAGF